MDLPVTAIVEEGLGNSAYVVDLGDGRAAVVDPERDPRPYLAEARRRRVQIAYAVETHGHADFVSGARELAAAGAEVLAARHADLAFPHRGVEPGQEIDLGGLSLRALATPGHTASHLSYALLDGQNVVGIFSGGALVVGGVARTDLVSPERTEELARAAYRSIRDTLLAYPDATDLWPTHGPGSFCSSGGGGRRTSTIGEERTANPLLAGGADEDEFVRRLLARLGTYPEYFRRLPGYNRRGPRCYADGWPELAALGVDGFRAAFANGAQLIDVRPIDRFAARHIPGALSIELRPHFQTWLGWLVDPDRPLAFVADADADRAELVRQCLNVGYEHIAGELAGGVGAWQEAGHPVQAITLTTFAHLDRRSVLDVRQEAERDGDHLPGAVHVELGSLPHTDVGRRPLAVMCAHGQRAMTAASILARRRGDTSGLTVLTEGVEQWRHRRPEGSDNPVPQPDQA